MRSVVRLCNLFFGETASLSAQVLGDATPLGGGVTLAVQAEVSTAHVIDAFSKRITEVAANSVD